MTLQATPFEVFYKDQIRTPQTAIDLAIADHAANGMQIYEYTDQLRKARERCDAYPKLVEALREAIERMRLADCESTRNSLALEDAIALLRLLGEI